MRPSYMHGIHSDLHEISRPRLGICTTNPFDRQASALAWRHSLKHCHALFIVPPFSLLSPFLTCTISASLPTSPIASLSHRRMMGTYVDDERAYSPSRRPTMIRRERREAKRRMVLLSLLGCFLFLTLVVFRQPNSFMSDYTYQSTNSTASTSSRTNSKAKLWFNGRPKSTGPNLSDSHRHLSDSSVADLKNTSLGVRELRMMRVRSSHC